MIITNKAYLIDINVANISQSFTHKMAPKTSWHRYGTKLRHCHPMYKTSSCSGQMSTGSNIQCNNTYAPCSKTSSIAMTID